MKKYILRHYKKEIEHSELDFTIREKLLGDSEENEKDWDDHGTIEKFDDNFWWGEVIEIDIDLAMKTLQELKDAGCNYVEIMHHGDHHGYVFVGAEIRLADDVEILVHELEKKEMSIEQRKKKIDQLEKELKKLKDE